MKKNKSIKFILIIISICNLSYSQDKKSDNDILINKTIDKYSRHLFLRAFYPYTIAMIDDYDTDNYMVISYLPVKRNKFIPQYDTANGDKINLIYNRVKVLGNHPVFWSSQNDTSNYDFVVNTMINYNLIDSFYLNYDKNKIYDADEYPVIEMNDKAIVVNYIIRRDDWKIIKKFRKRKYWLIYDYMDKLK